jgi:type III pantothenate kinase
MMRLVVKVGNSTSVAALYDDGRITRVRRLGLDSQPPGAVLQCLRQVVGKRRVGAAGLCSVVPALTRRWSSAIRRVTGVTPLTVSAELDLGVRLDYPRPETLGADRLANLAAVAAAGRLPAIVMDFGTATVFDVLAADGAFRGGVIAPGLEAMTGYLAQRTAQLPEIRSEGPVAALGRDTRSAMRIGCRVGYRGLVREILAHLEVSGAVAGAALYATGGNAARVLSDVSLACPVDPWLTLKGIGRILELNE